MKTNLIKDTSAYYIYLLGEFLLPLIWITTLTRRFGTESYGIIATTQIHVGLMVLLIKYSNPEYVILRIQAALNNQKEVSQCVTNSIFLQILLWFILSILYLLFILINFDGLQYYVSLTGIFLSLGLGLNLHHIFIAIGKSNQSLKSLFLARLLSTFILVFFIKQNSQLWLVLLTTGGLLIIANIVNFYYLYRLNYFEYSTLALKAVYRNIKEGKILFLNNLLVFFYTGFVSLILTFRLSATDIAIYSIAERIKNILQKLSTPLPKLLFPSMARLSSNKSSRFFHTAVKYIRLNIYISIFMALSSVYMLPYVASYLQLDNKELFKVISNILIASSVVGSVNNYIAKNIIVTCGRQRHLTILLSSTCALSLPLAVLINNGVNAATYIIAVELFLLMLLLHSSYFIFKKFPTNV